VLELELIKAEPKPESEHSTEPDADMPKPKSRKAQKRADRLWLPRAQRGKKEKKARKEKEKARKERKKKARSAQKGEATELVQPASEVTIKLQADTPKVKVQHMQLSSSKRRWLRRQRKKERDAQSGLGVHFSKNQAFIGVR
jgi:hypothetical protein